MIKSKGHKDSAHMCLCVHVCVVHLLTHSLTHALTHADTHTQLILLDCQLPQLYCFDMSTMATLRLTRRA